MAIALVSSVSRATAGTSASIDTTGASILIAALAWNTSLAGQATLTDSNGNIWSLLGASINQTTAALVLYAAINPTVGPGHTFTLVTSAASMCVAAFSGTATSFPFSKESNNSTGGATSLQPGSLTPEVANCLMISALSNRVATTYSIDSSFIITDQVPFSSGVQLGIALAYLIETSAAAKNPTWSWAGSGVAAAHQFYVQPPPSGGSSGGSYGFA